jgi:hypothetical protein
MRRMRLGDHDVRAMSRPDDNSNSPATATAIVHGVDQPTMTLVASEENAAPPGTPLTFAAHVAPNDARPSGEHAATRGRTPHRSRDGAPGRGHVELHDRGALLRPAAVRPVDRLGRRRRQQRRRIVAAALSGPHRAPAPREPLTTPKRIVT